MDEKVTENKTNNFQQQVVDNTLKKLDDHKQVISDVTKRVAIVLAADRNTYKGIREHILKLKHQGTADAVTVAALEASVASLEANNASVAAMPEMKEVAPAPEGSVGLPAGPAHAPITASLTRDDPANRE